MLLRRAIQPNNISNGSLYEYKQVGGGQLSNLGGTITTLQGKQPYSVSKFLGFTHSLTDYCHVNVLSASASSTPPLPSILILPNDAVSRPLLPPHSLASHAPHSPTTPFLGFPFIKL